MDVEMLREYKDQAVALVMTYATQLLLALLTLLVGLWIIASLTGLLRRTIDQRGVDQTLAPFLTNFFRWTLKILLFISVASMVGVQTTSFIAVLGAAGLAVGLALQGSLANFAGGVLLLVFRPIKAGDFIEAQGHMGTVKEIQIFTTTLLSPQNRRVIIPNGSLSNGSIINYTAEDKLRVDMVFGIAYDSDVDKAKKILMDLVTANDEVLSDPAPVVEVLELADSSVNLAVRPWSKTSDYWSVYFATLTKGKVALESEGISIPFPQRDVHLYNTTKNPS